MTEEASEVVQVLAAGEQRVELRSDQPHGAHRAPRQLVRLDAAGDTAGSKPASSYNSALLPLFMVTFEST